MAFTGYLKMPDIDGESKRDGHEDEIDLHGICWKVEQSGQAATGSGRTRSRAKVDSLCCYKYYDASSPYIALAAMQGKSFDEVVIMVRKDSGEAHLDYLQITMTNVIISSYEMVNGDLPGGVRYNDDEEEPLQMIQEKLCFDFEKVKLLYIVQAEDHSAGDEHEIEYDVVAGA